MSVDISQNPRHYGRRSTNSVQMNPPNCTCSAVLLDRKFISSNGPPAPVDARKLARTLNSQDYSPRKLNLSVYHDRLLFRSRSHGPKLPDIYFDDIIQLEIIPGRRNLLFILCGRQGIGSYYFFKLSDNSVAEEISDLARSVNPDLNLSPDDIDPKKNYSRRPADRLSKGNDFNSYRRSREYSEPSSSSSGNTSPSSSPVLRQQNSYIRWNGNLPNRNRSLDRQPGSRSAEGRQPIIRIYQNSSNHRKASSRRDGNRNAVFVNAERDGSTRSDRRKGNDFLVLEDDQMHSKPSTQHNLLRYKKTKNPPRNDFHRSTPRKPKTNYHGNGPMHRDYDDFHDYESAFDPTNEVQVGRPRYQSSKYKGGNKADFDWESNDSWDFFDDEPMNRFGGSAGTYGNGQYGADDFSDSFEDSLYLEKEQERRSGFVGGGANYLPELREKLRQIKIN